MKKNIFLLAAVAVAFTACTENNEVNPIEEVEVPVGFETFANKVTRATASTVLEGYHQSFGVWAYKTVTAGVTTVMDNYKAAYDADYDDDPKEQWNYEDVTGQYLKYWDKAASNYTFDAYAPYNDSNVSIANHVISIASGEYAANENIQADWSTDQNEGAFSGEGDDADDASTDWMLAAQVSRDNPISTDVVELAFTHILSKVVVKIVKADDFEPKITVSDVSLNNVYGTGSFNGTAWSTGTAAAVDVPCLEGVLPETAADEDPEPYYALECLVIPATVTPTFSLTYTIGDDDQEDFVVEDAEIETITSFAMGYNYVITVTIGPAPIHFDAEVEAWENATEADVTVD